MSRIGKKPIKVEEGVEITIDNREVLLKKDADEIKMMIPHFLECKLENNELKISNKSKSKESRAGHGTFRANLFNAQKGLTEGFKKSLEIKGVGYRAALEGNDLHFSLGYSHPIVFPLPEGISAKIIKNTITIEGKDKQKVGEVAAKIRALRPPEPYKGKGIKYVGEIIIRKAGKAAKAAAGATTATGGAK